MLRRTLFVVGEAVPPLDGLRVPGDVSHYRISADIGGTFTDLVVADPVKRVAVTGKVLTTTDDPARGVMTGLNQMIGDPETIDFIVHGTTVGLNAFLERKGSRVLLIMTAGLRDSYSIARGDRKTLYELQYRKPERLVPAGTWVK